MRFLFSIMLSIMALTSFSYVEAQVVDNKPAKGVFSARILSLFSSVTERTADGQVQSAIAPSLNQNPVIDQSTRSTPSKSSYKIAVVGDSMVDTMGEVLEYLEHSLKKEYPNTRFYLYNYGKGAQNVEDGLGRFFNEFNYQDRRYPSILTVQPDILIIGTFSYNPFSPHNPNMHIELLTELIKQGVTISEDLYLLIEPAPLRQTFGKGPNGVNWDQQTAYRHSGAIVEQLINSKALAQTLNIKTIDTFTPTFNPVTREGNATYINSSDGIHASVKGHEYIADQIVNTIQLK